MTEENSEQLTELEACILESANAGKALWVKDAKSWYIAAFVKLEKERLAIPDGDPRPARRSRCECPCPRRGAL